MRRYANFLDVKDKSSRLILDTLRRRKQSRADLAHATGLSRQSVSLIVDRLLEEGLVAEAGRTESGAVGRNPIRLEISGAGRYMIGVNLTRIHAQVGVANLRGEMVAQRQIPTGGVAAGECIEVVSGLVRELLAELRVAPETVLGIGVSAPGPLDYRTGTLRKPPAFSRWHGICIAGELSERTGLRVLVENVADAMAMEELFFGEGRESDSFMVLLVDEEIGAGIVINETLYRGRGGFGGEIGHVSIRYDGRECECGNRGCLSRYASIPALLAGTPYGSWRELVDADERNQQRAALLEQQAEYLATAITTAVNLFDLETVLLGGDVAYRPGELLGQINAKLRHRVITPAAQREAIAVATENKGSARTAIVPLMQEFYFHSRTAG